MSPTEPPAEIMQSQNRPKLSPPRSGGKKFTFVLGIFMMLFCGGLIVTYVAEIIVGQTKHGVSSQLGLITFLAGFVVWGWKLVQGRLTENKAIKELNEEQLILTRAKANGGMLTVSQTALQSQLSIADAKKAFERLSLSGICQIDVTEEGELCYRFPSLRPKAERDAGYIIGTSFENAQSISTSPTELKVSDS
ncbi:MAG: hypothetical protein SGJ27_05445 [Candidatus Melainabacteria bacterium]|mgnify:CR=1 FL=1|nr:hypothetical protein [Candidatus Melainabacteria bacterium]